MNAVVVPTNRPETIKNFLVRWKEQFEKHAVDFILVQDGETPQIYLNGKKQPFEIPRCIPRKCAGVRNAGFLFIAQKLPHITNIITLDDDMSPDGDTIGNHLKALNSRLPSSWFSTMTDAYPRGFPYGIRDETEVVLSHGVWQKNPDWDAPTQLVNGNKGHDHYYKGLIPKGQFFPFCGMNVAFKRKALPYVYYAPVENFKGAERFDDIFAGIAFKPEFDKNNWGIVSGYASCIHERASNVFYNLEKEAVGIRHNETYWQGETNHPWFCEFIKKRNEYKKLCQKQL
jgi:hypothetical protein